MSLLKHMVLLINVVYIHAKSPEEFKLFKEQAPLMQSLIKGLDVIEILDEHQQAPHGCMLETLSATNVLYLLVKGKVDLKKEVAKLTKRVVRSESSLKSTIKQTKISDYSNKVPEAIQEQNNEKIELLKSEISVMQDTIDKLKAIDLE